MNFIEEFIKKESSAGILLIIATIAALTLKNSFFSEYYSAFLTTPVEIRFADLHIAKPLLLWINDGLMAIFFLLIGLEVKRECPDAEVRHVFIGRDALRDALRRALPLRKRGKPAKIATLCLHFVAPI